MSIFFSGGYREPWDSVPFSEESEQMKCFNQSVRHQIMKGTGGGFRTFKGSIKVDSVQVQKERQ